MKHFFLFIMLFLCLKSLHSQSGFQDHFVDGEFSIRVSDIEIADVDNDGYLDAISCSSIDRAIHWYKNIEGKGEFRIGQNITTIDNRVKSIYSTDIDNDGDVDIITASNFDNKISWYENIDGKGNFVLNQTITSNAIDARDVYAEDLDGDGDMDIISASYDDNKVAWYENLNGLGDFSEEKIITTNAEGANTVFAVDLDNDNDIDILSASFVNGKVAWYENLDGQGTFGSQNVIMNYNTANSVYAEDIDNDGDMDVFSVSYFGEEIAWNENLDGQGNFGTKQIIASDVVRPTSIYIDDIDDDGNKDLVSASDNDDIVAWYKNLDGQGNFGTKNIISSNNNLAIKVAVADIDVDGRLDVISASSSDYKIAWYKNLDGQGDFSIEKVIAWGPRRPVFTFPADINNDGNLDVVSASEVGNKVVWHEQIDDTGSFKTEKIISVNTSAAKSVFVADIDGDNDMDVVSASSDDNKIAWHENLDGQGTFGDQKIISITANGAQSVYVSDIDGDNDLDIISASNNDDKIAWYENLNGQGDFGTEQIISTNADGAQSVSVIDIDGDNDMDIVSASLNDDKIAWYENLDGQGAFSTEKVISNSANGAVAVYIADIDGDNDMDIISASSYDDKIAWYENLDGLGNYGSETIISTNVNDVKSLALIDLDNDGDIDIASASKADDKVVWFANLDGLGSFGTEQLVSLNVLGANSISAGDINADGFFDLITTSNDNYEIYWHENLGSSNNLINGVVKYDLDSNGCDNLDNGAEGVMVLAKSSTESFATFSSEDGTYELIVNEGEYNVEIINTQPTLYTKNPNFDTVNFIGDNNTYESDFCLSLIPEPEEINDLSIVIYPLSDARPGFDASYRLVYKNIGASTLSGFVNLEYDDLSIEYVNSSETPSSQAFNNISFNFTDLSPQTSRTIDIFFNIKLPPIVESEDVLVFTATVNPILDDINPEDNTYKLTQVVINSYDPNDIRVLEGNQIFIDDKDKYLHYIIRFQNTGTASAINVRVENELNEKLNWSTMQLESLSHEGRVEIEKEKDVSFIFDNINLPDSTSNEVNSHGFIAYKIKPKVNISVGDIIYNTADIYFDFNLPIKTNTVSTEIAETLSLDIVDSNNTLKIFPNPVESELTILGQSIISKVKIIDVNGRVLNTKHNNLNDKKMTLKVNSLSKGIYFLAIYGEIENHVLKFVKK